MELYERIRYLADTKEVTLANIAKKLNFPQTTFHQWLKPGSQKNLWEHLPKILEIFPDVRPEWLYMGEEPAFKDGTTAEKRMSDADVNALLAENARLKAELAEADRVNRKLTTRLLLEGASDQDGQTGTGGAGEGQG